jgi:cyanophycin synthetase
MLGSVQVNLPSNYDFQALDQALGEFIFEAVPRSPPGAGVAQALARRAMHWTAALQRQCRIPVSECIYIGPAAKTPDKAIAYSVAIPCVAPQATTAVLKWVTTAVRAFLATGTVSPHDPEQAQQAFNKLQHALQRFAEPGQNRFYILQAAQDLDIPVRHVVPGVHCFGTGCCSRWLNSSITDQTSSIGVQIARDKVKTATVLRQAGLPAPIHVRVANAEQAVHVARKLGYPVVIKPADQEQGRGVAADLRDDANVTAAYRDARKWSKDILVEKHFDGIGHRLTIFHDRVIKVTKKTAGGVLGDGVRTVEELVEEARRNLPPRRTASTPDRLPLELDTEAVGMLEQQGLSRHGIPASDQYVGLRRRNNSTAGGTTTLLPLDTVHPDNLVLAVSAARALRLDLAGVDLLISDISKSWLETGALICEVNSQPQGGQKEMFKILGELMQGGYRVPVHLIVCPPELTPPPGPVIDGLMHDLQCNGLAMTSGVRVNQQRLTGEFKDGFTAARVLLNNQDTESALCWMTPQEIIQFGLPADCMDSVRLWGSTCWPAKEQAALEPMLKMLKPHASEIIHQ